ncbi:MAG: thermonuclease family protein [Deltaproteobacteria bacterium]|nr:thermonuclease family protein [Deltaproteobacteria bacterium]
MRRYLSFLLYVSAATLLLFATPALSEEIGRVVEVVDGDTLRVRVGGEDRTVRLIGIDAPERSHPERPREYFGDESAEYLSSLLKGRSVRMETGAEDADAHGRLLRYVFLPSPDGRLVNLDMVRQGYALAMRRFPFSRSAEFLLAEQEANREGKGLWKEGGLAELRWLREGHGAPVEVWPAAGRKFVVVYQDRAKTGVLRHELGRTIEEIIRLRAELSEGEFEGKALGAGFYPLSPPLSPDGRQAAVRPPEGSSAPQRPPRPSDVVSWEEAHRHVGREVVVEGKIVRAHRGKKVLYLNFHPNWKKYLTVVILGRDLGRFPKDAEKYYMGKKVRVRGEVALYRDRPEIVVRSPDAITVVR